MTAQNIEKSFQDRKPSNRNKTITKNMDSTATSFNKKRERAAISQPVAILTNEYYSHSQNWNCIRQAFRQAVSYCAVYIGDIVIENRLREARQHWELTFEIIHFLSFDIFLKRVEMLWVRVIRKIRTFMLLDISLANNVGRKI